MSIENRLTSLETSLIKKIDTLNEANSINFAGIDKRILIVLNTNKQSIAKFNDIDKQMDKIEEKFLKLSEFQKSTNSKLESLEIDTKRMDFDGGLAISCPLQQSIITNDFGDQIQDVGVKNLTEKLKKIEFELKDLKGKQPEKSPTEKNQKSHNSEKNQNSPTEKSKLDHLENLINQEIVPKINKIDDLTQHLEETRKIINDTQKSLENNNQEKESLMKQQNEKYRIIDTLENLVMQDIYPKIKKFNDLPQILEEARKIINQLPKSNQNSPSVGIQDSKENLEKNQNENSTSNDRALIQEALQKLKDLESKNTLNI